MHHHRSLLRLVASVVVSAAALTVFASRAQSTTSWNVVESPNPTGSDCDLRGVCAVSADEGWAVGSSVAPSGENRTLILHRINGAWSVTASPNPGASCTSGNVQWGGNVLNALTVVSASDVWAVGYDCYSSRPVIEHWNGAAWSLVPSPDPGSAQHTLSGVSAVSASDVWAVGYSTGTTTAGPLVEHWNGTQWSIVSAPAIGNGGSLNAVAALAANDVWGVGGYFDPNNNRWETLIEHWNGASWSIVPSPSTGTLGSMAVVSATDIWAVGNRSSGGSPQTLAVHWDGQHWSVIPSPNVDVPSGGTTMLCSVAAISANDVWAAGVFHNEQTDINQRRTLLEHWDGSSWSIVAAPSPGRSAQLNGIATTPAGEAWSVGLYSDYAVNIYDGTYTLPQTLVLAGGGQATGVGPGAIASGATLGLPTPNPATSRVSFALQLPSRTSMSLVIYDVRGREVRSILAGRVEAGTRMATWDGFDSRGALCAPGVYFARLTVNGAIVASRSVAMLGATRAGLVH